MWGGVSPYCSSPHSRIKSPLSGPRSVLAFAEIRRRVVHTKIIEKEDSVEPLRAGGLKAGGLRASSGGNTLHVLTDSGRGAAKSEDAQGTPTQSHTSPMGGADQHRCRCRGARGGSRSARTPPVLRGGSNRLFQALDLYWCLLESGDVWYT